MKYTYTAVISYDKDKEKYFCRVPDLPGCITTGCNLSDSIDMIRDAASVWLVSSEDHGDEVIPPTPQALISHTPDDILSILQIDTIRYRAENDTHAVRKTVSIPVWMANLAGKHGLNLSQILQDSLRSVFETKL